jgi:hypothetical protein
MTLPAIRLCAGLLRVIAMHFADVALALLLGSTWFRAVNRV